MVENEEVQKLIWNKAVGFHEPVKGKAQFPVYDMTEQHKLPEFIA